jgi:hypothetical protein
MKNFRCTFKGDKKLNRVNLGLYNPIFLGHLFRFNNFFWLRLSSFSAWRWSVHHDAWKTKKQLVILMCFTFTLTLNVSRKAVILNISNLGIIVHTLDNLIEMSPELDSWERGCWWCWTTKSSSPVEPTVAPRVA